MEEVVNAVFPEQARAIAGGIAQHSLGPIYPYLVVGIGNGDRVDFEVHNLQRGTVMQTNACKDRKIPWRTKFYEEAYAVAEMCVGGRWDAAWFQ